MDTLAHIHQQINPFLYQKRPRDFHTYLNVPQEDFVPSCTTGIWSFPGKTAFLFYSPQHYLRLPVTLSEAAARAGLAVSLGVRLCDSVCLEVAVWTCGAPAEPCVKPCSALPALLAVPALRRFAGVRFVPGLAGTDGELGFGFPAMIPV